MAKICLSKKKKKMLRMQKPVNINIKATKNYLKSLVKETMYIAYQSWGEEGNKNKFYQLGVKLA